MTRSKISVIVAEFFGTALLTSAVLAQANSNVIVNKTWFVAAIAGLTLTTIVLTIGRVSGAHVNPAITIGLWTLRKIETTTAIVYIAAQLLGAAVALRLFQYLQNDALQNIAGPFEWRIFVAEAVGALVFSFGVAAAVTQKLQGLRAAFAIGTSLMLGAIIASTASNGILNPAVALGLNSWSLTYLAAPVLGAVLGMNLYDLFLAPESELKAQSKAMEQAPAKKVAKSKKKK
jgi:glycerol uptake facilitator-like aquaporin